MLRFSIGFGKSLWSRRGADGTEYALAAIPLGGYVKLLDEREGPVDPSLASEAYNRKPVWARILVLLAGPLANFLFAVVAYWVLFVAGVPALKPVLGDVAADTPAARAGLQQGDEIVGVGAKDTATRETAVLAHARRADERQGDRAARARRGRRHRAPPASSCRPTAGHSPSLAPCCRAWVSISGTRPCRRRSARCSRAARPSGPACARATRSWRSRANRWLTSWHW